MAKNSRIYCAREYLLHLLNPIFRIWPRATIPRSSRCIIFSLYSGKLDAMSLIPSEPPTRNISRMFWTRDPLVPFELDFILDTLGLSDTRGVSFIVSDTLSMSFRTLLEIWLFCAVP